MNRELSGRSHSIAHPALNRRAVAKQRTRERLLDAARRLINERGYEAATVRDIAAAAQLSTGAVFASFNDKAELFSEVLFADHQGLSERMAQMDLKDLEVREALLRLMGLACERHLEQLGLVQAAISFSWQRDAGAETRSRRGLKLILSLVSAALIRGVERGELSPGMDVKLVSEMIWDAYLSNFRRAIFDQWQADALMARLALQIDTLLEGYRTAA